MNYEELGLVSSLIIVMEHQYSLYVGWGIYYETYKPFHTWSVGVLILFITIATAFIGYITTSVLIDKNSISNINN